jgi:hypothetical protein
MDAAAVAEMRESRMVVVVARATETATPNTIWIAWKPQTLTALTWTDAYGVFAAIAPRDAAPPTILSVHLRAREGAVHPFAGGRFHEPILAGRTTAAHYDVRNEERDALAFGLLQAASVDGVVAEAPLNLVVVPPGFTANFGVPRRFYLWTAVHKAPGDPLAAVPFDAAEATYARTRSHRFSYDRSAARFRIVAP